MGCVSVTAKPKTWRRRSEFPSGFRPRTPAARAAATHAKQTHQAWGKTLWTKRGPHRRALPDTHERYAKFRRFTAIGRALPKSLELNNQNPAADVKFKKSCSRQADRCGERVAEAEPGDLAESVGMLPQALARIEADRVVLAKPR